MHKSKRRYSMF